MYVQHMFVGDVHVHVYTVVGLSYNVDVMVGFSLHC